LPASTPQTSGGVTEPAGNACVSAGSWRVASHAATALMSVGVKRLAISDMQSGAAAARVPVRQEPSCELM
jgi:hypothetical protein